MFFDTSLFDSAGKALDRRETDESRIRGKEVLEMPVSITGATRNKLREVSNTTLIVTKFKFGRSGC